MRRLLGSSLVAAFIIVQVPQAARPLQQAPKGRSIIVISDLHMGVGRDAAGAWHPYEDFRWGPEFAAFLTALNAEGGGATDLILNGDTFELLQSLEKDCTYADASLGCTEPEALARFERVLAAHPIELKALSDFAGAGSNRVVFVPGDHDAALLFPALGRRLMAALGAPAGRAELATSGYWRSADGKIYAEHGHQLDFSASKYDNWPSPFVVRSGREHLVRPWGEQVAQEFYDRHEAEYPVLDNFAEERAGVKFGLAAAGVADAGEASAQLLRYFLFQLPWPHFRTDLESGEIQPPIWDLAKVRAEGPAFLLASLPDDDRFRPLTAKALNDGRLTRLMSELTDTEVTAICDYRAAVRRSRRRFEQGLTQFLRHGPVVAECPRTPETRGAAFGYFWQTRDSVIARRVEAVQTQSPNAGGRVTVFLYGHTHLPQPSTAFLERNPEGAYPEFGFSWIRNATTPVAANSGAWQRTVTPNQLDSVKNDRGMSDAALLGSVSLDELPPCYSFIQVGPYDGTPAPRPRHWYQPENGRGEHLAQNCNRRPFRGVSPIAIPGEIQ